MSIPINYNKASWSERRAALEEYVRVQNGLCHHCNKSLSGPESMEIMEKWVDEELFPETFFNYPVHLHHDHDTGMTIGAVHCRCNAVLWQYHGE